MFTYLLIFEDKKANLFLKELILSWAIIGEPLFLSFKFSRKPVVRDVLLLLNDKADSGLKRCSDSLSLSHEISERPLDFQIFLTTLKSVLVKRFEPHCYKCKSLPPRCKFSNYVFIHAVNLYFRTTFVKTHLSIKLSIHHSCNNCLL